MDAQVVGSGMQRRARRFPIRASLLFRRRGESAWRHGLTVNVSRTGVLFHADGPLPGAGQGVDFVLTLPLDGSTPAPQVRSTGRVARTMPAAHGGLGHTVAVSIDGYALEGRRPAWARGRGDVGTTGEDGRSAPKYQRARDF